MTEGDSLDDIRVKAIFYALYFGEDVPSRRAHRQFAGYFVAYEERTRTVEGEGGEVVEETYTVAVPITDIPIIYANIESALGITISKEQKANADSVYNLVRYGVASGTEGWIEGADTPFIGADGFCLPIGAGWESRVTSEFGNRVDPFTGQRKGHTGMDLAVPLARTCTLKSASTESGLIQDTTCRQAESGWQLPSAFQIRCLEDQRDQEAVGRCPARQGRCRSGSPFPCPTAQGRDSRTPFCCPQ